MFAIYLREGESKNDIIAAHNEPRPCSFMFDRYLFDVWRKSCHTEFGMTEIN